MLKDIEKVKFSLSRYVLEMEKMVFHLYTKRDDYGIPASAKESLLDICAKTICLQVAELIMNTVNQMMIDLNDQLIFPQLQVIGQQIRKGKKSFLLPFFIPLLISENIDRKCDFSWILEKKI